MVGLPGLLHFAGLGGGVSYALLRLRCGSNVLEGHRYASAKNGLGEVLALTCCVLFADALQNTCLFLRHLCRHAAWVNAQPLRGLRAPQPAALPTIVGQQSMGHGGAICAVGYASPFWVLMLAAAAVLRPLLGFLLPLPPFVAFASNLAHSFAFAALNLIRVPLCLQVFRGNSFSAEGSKDFVATVEEGSTVLIVTLSWMVG